MTEHRDRPHIIINAKPHPEDFSPRILGRKRPEKRQPINAVQHSERLRQEYQRASTPVADTPEERGAYITFASFPGLELAIDSLESSKPGQQPRLVAVRQDPEKDGAVIKATVFLPRGTKEVFLDKLNKYAESINGSDNPPKNQTLIEGIQSIKRATIRELWTDPIEEFPDDLCEVRWWEVWLRSSNGQEAMRLQEYANQHNLKIGDHYLGFGERTVMLLQTTADHLAQTFRTIDDLAELRRPHEIAAFLTALPAIDQQAWVQDLLERVELADRDQPTVCILDRGVQTNHPLLAGSLSPDDVHAVDARWNKNLTFYSHGTEMAGRALFSDLHAAVAGNQAIQLHHRLESVKLLPDSGENDVDMYGAVTARAVDQPEIAFAERNRVFMLPVTAPWGLKRGELRSIEESGRPTAWSAAVDALCFGRSIEDGTSSTATPGKVTAKLAFLGRQEAPSPRLFVVSAGNIRDIHPEDNHLTRCDAEPVEDPAQAWNAITVGAYAEHDTMAYSSMDFAGYTPVPPRGELSPTSRTSVSFDQKRWPFKPEVVAPGGNMARSPDAATVDTPENLAILTTRRHTHGQGAFTTTRDTSAASAWVAGIAADIYAAYPLLRPETVRALLVHSAEWTSTMQAQFAISDRKQHRNALRRRYGMGVPDLERATRSATNALTLVDEAIIHPYERKGASNEGRTCEMNLHALPWPEGALENLGGTSVRLRVTLSYFIEPNPSSRGWSGRYVYPSHGLRFAMKRPEETISEFRESINSKASSGNSTSVSRKTEEGWFFGKNEQLSPGSLHTDIWEGPASQLAAKGAIAVYPVAGWWKNRAAMDQSAQGVHYALVVSIDSPEVDVDLWTPVYEQVATAVEV